MDAQKFIRQLEESDPDRRRDAAHIIGMVDEVDALPALYRAVKVEPVPAVKQAMVWAGKRLQAAQSAEYTTLDAIWFHFHIDRDVFPPEDDRDEPFLGLDSHQVEMLSAQVSYEAALQKVRNRTKTFGAFALAGIPGAIMSTLGSSLSGSTAIPHVLEASVGIPNAQRRRRAVPLEPTTTDIRSHVKRLLSEPIADKRRKAAMSLRDLNNPDALSSLALAFINDPDTTVSQTAHLAGKLIYWNAVYWKLEKEGFIAEEIRQRIETFEAETKNKRKIRRLERRGDHPTTEASVVDSAPQPTPEAPTRPAIRRLPKLDTSESVQVASEAPTQVARPRPAASPTSDGGGGSGGGAPKAKPKPPDPDKEMIERLLKRGFDKRRRPY